MCRLQLQFQKTKIARVYSLDEFQKIQLFAYVSRDRTDKSECYQKKKTELQKNITYT